MIEKTKQFKPRWLTQITCGGDQFQESSPHPCIHFFLLTWGWFVGSSLRRVALLWGNTKAFPGQLRGGGEVNLEVSTLELEVEHWWCHIIWKKKRRDSETTQAKTFHHLATSRNSDLKNYKQNWVQRAELAESTPTKLTPGYADQAFATVV